MLVKAPAAGLRRSDSLTFADWAQAEQLPVILVVGVKLGCINHAMLTAQAARQAGLPLAGWIATNDDAAAGQAPRRISGDAENRLAAPFLGEYRGLPISRSATIRPVSGPQGAGSGVIHRASGHPAP